MAKTNYSTRSRSNKTKNSPADRSDSSPKRRAPGDRPGNVPYTTQNVPASGIRENGRASWPDLIANFKSRKAKSVKIPMGSRPSAAQTIHRLRRAKYTAGLEFSVVDEVCIKITKKAA